MSAAAEVTEGTKAGGDARVLLSRRMKYFAVAAWIVAVGYGFYAMVKADSTRLLFAVMIAVTAGLYMWRSSRLQGLGSAVTRINEAYGLFTAGKVDEAEALVATVAPREIEKSSYFRRAMDILRAAIAFQRGDLEEVVVVCTRSMEGPTRFATRLHEAQQIVSARAVRALALGLLGRRAPALTDAAAVLASPLLDPVSLARISLAKASLLAKDGRLEELRAHYAAEGDALVEDLGPSERFLSRALRRMGQARARSVYREPAPIDEADTEATRDWVRLVAPDAARFVPSAVRTTNPSHEPAPAARAAVPDPAAVGEIETRFGKARKGARWPARRRLLWGGIALLLVVGFFLPTLLAPVLVTRPVAHHAHQAATAGPADTTFFWSFAALFGGIFGAFVPLRVWLVRRRQRSGVHRLRRAQLMIAREQLVAGKAELTALARTNAHLAVPAHQVLAQVAIREGDFSAAQEACARAVGLATQNLVTKANLQDLMLPELLSLHAFALAAAGNEPAALAGLALLLRDYPRYAFLARAEYRVNLLNAVTRGDVAEAARLVAQRSPAMLLELRVDLLGEVVGAVAAGGLPDAQAAGLQAELAAMPSVARWIEQVAPGLTARIHRGAGFRIAAHESTRELALEDDRLDAAAILGSHGGLA